MTPPPLDEDEEMPVPHSEPNAGAQPMEVAPLDTGTTAESQQQQAEDPPTTFRFTWTIEHFSRLHSKMHYSDVFTVGGYKWRVSIFPKGKNVDHLSMYLDVADSTALSYGWSRYAQFSLSVINQIHSKYTVRKETQHQFNARESDWGFTSFMPLSDLYDPSRGYIVNDTCILEAEIAVRKIRLMKEQEEKEYKDEKANAHLYKIIKVARDVDLRVQIGRDIYFDLVDLDKVRSFRIQKQLPFKMFKDAVAKEFGIPVQFQRFWLWARRVNRTYRPYRPLTPQEEARPVGQLREITNKLRIAELNLFLEVEIGVDLQPLHLPDKTKENILIFFKLYHPEKEELRYVGRLFVKASGKPSEILSKLNEMAGFLPNEEIELYEEIKYEQSVMCEPIDKTITFRNSQLEDGDIICFQKSPSLGSEDQYRYPDAPSFLEYVHNHQVVHFRSLETPKEDDFCLKLSKLFTYDDVVERVARQLGLDDPSKIRLTSHNCCSQQPEPQPIKYRGVERLSDMLVHYNQISDILYYEVFDIPLPELQCLRTLKVAFHPATMDEVVIYTIRLPKNSTVGVVINDLKTKVELSHPNAELRLLEVFYHKIYKIFPASEKIENVNDQYWTLRAEEIPEEEKNLGPHDRLIHVYHFMKDPNQNQMQVQNFGEPFLLVIHEGETLANVKARIQKRLQVRDEEFSKWKFAFLSLGRPEYLQDSDVVSSRFQRRDVYGAWDQYLGLEHSDTTPKRIYTANQKRRAFEKPVMAAPSSPHVEEISHVVTTAPPENTTSAQAAAAPASVTKGGPTTVMSAPDDIDKQMRESSTIAGSASSPHPPEYERSLAVLAPSPKFQCLEDGRRVPSYYVRDDESAFMDCTTALKLAENSLLCKDHSAALKKVPYESLVNMAVWYSQMLSSVNAEMRHRASSMSELELALPRKLQASEKALEDTKARLAELNKSLDEEKAARKVAEEKVTAVEGKAIAIEGMLATEREKGENERSSLRSQIKALFDQI